MTTIYLVRHGENKANITKEFSYKRVDYSLTPKGVLQAQQTATYFKDKHISAIYSSPLKRAKETAEIIAQPLGLSVVIMEQFREVNIGDLEGQPPDKEHWTMHDAILADWFSDKPETTFPGGENYIMLLRRMREGLRIVIHDHPEENVVIVGHGGIFTSTIRDVCSNVDWTQLLRVENANCSITKIQTQLSEGSIDGTLEMWASHAHLSDEAAKLVSGHPKFEEQES